VRRPLYTFALLALTAATVDAGCQIAANIDRDRIPSSGGSGPGAGGSAGMGGGGAGPCANGAPLAPPESCPGQDTDCRKRACVEGACGFINEPSATTCSARENPDAKLCDGLGNCVVCLEAPDCPAEKPVCLNNECLVPTCGDMLKNGVETDVDCGGMDCSGCDNGQDCLIASDCVSGFCQGGAGGGAALGECAPCVNPGDCQGAMMCMNGVCQ
jgi:hypothetical protein